jgi:acetolactate synthase-1/2/3 large subunit
MGNKMGTILKPQGSDKFPSRSKLIPATRICDLIAKSLSEFGVKRVHGLMGGGAAGLNDGFISSPNIDYICYHHEQSAGHSAIGESKYSGRLAVVNPTTGCGGTNCITSVVNAWQDSVPILFLSGNTQKNTCTNYIKRSKGVKLRTYGIQEHDIISTVKDITKFSAFVDNAEDIPELLQSAISASLSGRKGPVWLDIPINVQLSMIQSVCKIKNPQPENKKPIDFKTFEQALKSSHRPLILAGGGIRQSGNVDAFDNFINKYNIPFITSYPSRDLSAHSNPLNIGTVGIKGSRAGNFAVQNCDLLLILGCRLASPVIGYDPSLFSPDSFKIMVDIDPQEIEKDGVIIDMPISSDLSYFFQEVL